jgi:SAM-dependent methyltransferase
MSNNNLPWLAHLRQIRQSEIEKVADILKQLGGHTILEIGAGAGWQAQYLTERGFELVAIDIADSNYGEVRTWPVIEYDGHSIPLQDNSVDIVFSSNVLEHIREVEQFQSEIHRVLKPGGHAVHVLPTSSWRFWTSITSFPDKIRRFAASRYGRKTESSPSLISTGTAIWSRRRNLWKRLLWFFPGRHGEFGNSFTELYYFSRYRWTRLFQRTGWQVTEVLPNGLFYTGYSILGARFSLSWRAKASRLIGSSCLIYVLKTDAKVNS